MIDILDWFELEEQEINCIRCNKHIYIAKQLYDVTKNYVCNQCWLSQEDFMSKFFMGKKTTIEVTCKKCWKSFMIPEDNFSERDNYICKHCLEELERKAKLDEAVERAFRKGKK